MPSPCLGFKQEVFEGKVKVIKIIYFFHSPVFIFAQTIVDAHEVKLPTLAGRFLAPMALGWNTLR